jgi:hypothetical protein
MKQQTESVTTALQRLEENLNGEIRLMRLSIDGLEQRLVEHPKDDSDRNDAFLAFNLQWQRLEKSIIEFTSKASEI